MLKNKSAFLKRARMISGLLLTFVVAFTCFTACDGSDDMMLQAGNGNSALNDYVNGLDYDLNDIIDLQGNTVGNVVPKTAHFEGDTYIVDKQEKCVDEDELVPIVPYYSKETIYPGALIYANNDILKCNPKLIDVERGAATVSLYLPGMEPEESTKVVSDVTHDNVISAANEILNRYSEKNGAPYRYYGSMKCKQGLIYDEKTLQIDFGINFDYLQSKFQINLDGFKNNERSLYLVEYTQEVATVCVRRFLSPSEAFADSVTPDELRAKGVNNENPPAYVSYVTYGRRLYLLYSSKAKAQDLEKLLSGVFSDGYIGMIKEGGFDNYDDVKKSTVYYVARDDMVGGDRAIPMTMADPVWLLTSELSKLAVLDKLGSFAPLTYGIELLKERSEYIIKGRTEYVKRTREKHPSGALNILHSGAYPAKIYVTWDEIIGYDSSGNEIVTKHDWDQNGETKGAGFKTSIPLGGNCCNVSIKVKGYSGLKYQPWFNSFEKTGLAVVPNREIVIRGTTLKQTITCNPET